MLAMMQNSLIELLHPSPPPLHCMIAATSTDGQLNNGETDVDCKLLGLDGRRLVLEQAHARGAAPAVQPRHASVAGLYGQL